MTRGIISGEAYEMQTFFTGFIFGVISVIAIGIFVWTLRRGKGDSSGTLKSRVDRNNIDTGQGLDRLKGNNTESGRIIDRAGRVATGGLKSIEDTNRTVSGIIAAAKRDKGEESEG